jgi:hypothetical protein
MRVHILSFRFPVSAHVYTLDSTVAVPSIPKTAWNPFRCKRRIHSDNPKTRTESRSRPLLLPVGATFYLFEAFLPFAAPPVAGALFGLPPPTLGSGGGVVGCLRPVGTLAASALGYRGRAESVCVAPGGKGTHGTGTRIRGVRRETSASALFLRHIDRLVFWVIRRVELYWL